MLIVVSPAKSLDYESPLATTKYTQPGMLERSAELIAIMRTKSAAEVGTLMSISPSLAQLNVERYADWEPKFTKQNSRQALLAFNGDVYDGMAAKTTFSDDDFAYAQKTLRILSGLHGLLRPLDLMMPYRLEMGTKLHTPGGSNLYDFWGDDITVAINTAVKKSPGDRVLVNLASQEYFESVKRPKLTAPVISPAFFDHGPSGDRKIISFFAKKARGIMSAWIIRERIISAADLLEFSGAGYEFDAARSTPDRPVFVR